MNAYASSTPPPRLASKYPRRRTSISLTPLIDVVFILLLFFMLASSLLTWRSIELDAAAKAAPKAGKSDAVLVEIRADGIRLAGKIISLDQLGVRLHSLLDRSPERKVLVKPSEGIVLQQAVDVLDHLAAAGVRNLSLVRDPAK
jgi:biopolymer transport protein ExbD